MKTLILIRHAQALADSPSGEDRDRPLDARGERDAERLGQRLARHGRMPELIIASPAARALGSARHIASALGYGADRIRIEDRLYASSAEALLALIRSLDDGLERVALVGHNPEFGELAHRFSHEIVAMPTCAAAKFVFDETHWARVGRSKPSESSFDSPQHPAH